MITCDVYENSQYYVSPVVMLMKSSRLFGPVVNYEMANPSVDCASEAKRQFPVHLSFAGFYGNKASSELGERHERPVENIFNLQCPARLFLLFAIVAVLFIAGCTIKEPKSLGCCKKDTAKDNNQCVLIKQDAAEENADTLDCNVETGFCNITIKEGSDDTTVEVPICSDAQEISCIQPSCKAMVCGPYKFRPSISPSLADMKAGGDKDGPSSYDSAPQGIWNMSCGFEYLDDKLQNLFKNTKGAFMNTFRLGVGPSFAEYDVAKFSLPLSDVACNANPSGTVDRYMNYLVTPDYYADNLAPSAYNSKYSQYKNKPKTPYPFDPVEDIGKEACMENIVSSVAFEPFNTLPYGGKPGG
ncbi:TPA: hypothetical protein HA238_02280, partial [Candidatus Micrarchaeota archaeon]|nr:hypothetical protein [Candidatus Micrarchaeota archaeon]